MAVGVVTWAGDADAAFKIQLDNPSTAPVEATIADGDLDGLIPFGPGVGNFTVNVGVGISKPQLGSAFKPRLDLSSYDSSTRAGTIVIKMTDTGFTSPAGAAFLSIGGTTDGTITYKAYWDPSNAEFGTAHQIGSTMSFGPGGLNFPFSGGQTIGGIGGLTPFSLTQIITITHTGSAIRATSFNAGLLVPEPSSIALLFVGLAGLAATLRRRPRSPNWRFRAGDCSQVVFP
jgi:hypothetical protein